jgi:hypothetical protein
MIECPVCHDRVYNNLLREENPKCPNGHEIGRWVSCENEEKHVYLEYKVSECPYCGNKTQNLVPEGTAVKCLHVNVAGMACITRPFLWIKEGPPCFMNHVSKMKIVSA